MKYGHLENERLVYAKLPITINGMDYFTDNKALMLEAGEKEIVETEKPSERADGSYTTSWKETETQIVREWLFVPYKEEDLYAKYSGLTIRYIHEKYPISKENKVLREYLAYGESHKAQFDEYNAYVEECKIRARAEVYGENTSME